MQLWPRTRPITEPKKLSTKPNGRADNDEVEYDDEYEEIDALKAEVATLKALIALKDEELERLRANYNANSQFQQTVIMELISRKKEADAKPAGQMASYIAKKNAEAVTTDNKKPKLP